MCGGPIIALFLISTCISHCSTPVGGAVRPYSADTHVCMYPSFPCMFQSPVLHAAHCKQTRVCLDGLLRFSDGREHCARSSTRQSALHLKRVYSWFVVSLSPLGAAVFLFSFLSFLSFLRCAVQKTVCFRSAPRRFVIPTLQRIGRVNYSDSQIDTYQESLATLAMLAQRSEGLSRTWRNARILVSGMTCVCVQLRFCK